MHPAESPGTVSCRDGRLPSSFAHLSVPQPSVWLLMDSSAAWQTYRQVTVPSISVGGLDALGDAGDTHQKREAVPGAEASCSLDAGIFSRHG